MKSIRNGDQEVVLGAGSFDEEWYVEQYPDVKMLGMDPLEHYLWIGSKIGRLPSPQKTARLQADRIICEDSGSGLPDLFLLRAKPPVSQRALVIWSDDEAAVQNMISSLPPLQTDLDVVLITHERNLASRLALHVPSETNYVGAVYGHKICAWQAFFHLVNSGAFAHYATVSWAGFFGDLNEDCHSSIERQPAEWATQSGLYASSFQVLPEELRAGAYAAMSTFMGRVGRKRPDEVDGCPFGSVVVTHPLILKQIPAYRIQPAEIAGDRSGQWLASAVLAAICSEAGLKRSTHGQNGALAVQKGPEFKAIAFYLPQFHPINENDRWWGKGFTEWTNVTKARPMFRSHFQPNLPADLGFYDLRTPETQEAQADLASEFGIHGFCYYYYWFAGRKLLNRPIEQMLNSSSPNFPFCVCWANENWSRNWDGQNRHVLLEQSYSLESNRALIGEFIEMMKDSRYIRHNGKPVLLVYRIQVIPNWLETASMWREECRQSGLGDIHLCAVRFGLEELDGQPSDFGVDSFVLFPPHETKRVDVKSEVLDLAPDFHGTIFSYDAVVDGDLERFEAGYPWPVHRGAMLGWDNTARRQYDSRIFVGATPARFHYWLKGIVEQERLHNQNSESLVFINAWNEWAEGTTLEPSVRFGRGYLEAVRSVLGQPDVKRLDTVAARVIDSSPRPSRSGSPRWFDGNIERISGAPTVLVCAHVVSDKLFGGERSFLDVLDALNQLHLNVVVVLPSGNHREYIELVQGKSIGVAIVAYRQWTSGRLPDEDIIAELSELIESQSIDLVYANTIVLLEPLIAARRKECQTVVHARELIDRDEHLIKQIGMRPEEIVREVWARADFVVANSLATHDLFFKKGRTFCVPNVVDASGLDMLNEASAEIVFGIISSNIPKKGIADFIDVARRCQETVPNAKFFVFGPENEYVEEWKREGLPSNLTFRGYSSSPADALAQINVLLSLSHFAESFGRTIAEAQAARRPVIAYDHGAVSELVEHERTGLLAGYRDIERVAAHVQELASNETLITRMGDAGRSEVVKRNAPTTLRENLWRALEGILGRSLAMRSSAARRTTIIVPVFNAYAEVKGCLDSLAASVDGADARILVIDDGSTDARIRELLAGYSRRQGFHVLINEQNLGYTRTINRGIHWCEEDDVVLLNSDTVVTRGFLDGLRKTARSRAKVGTVTAMGDNAGAFSFPNANEPNPKPDAVAHEKYVASITARSGCLEPVEVPTGSGFCMFIRRELFQEIGYFDEEAFPRGYGEENDFCMRALAAGWVNLISPNTYIFHVRSASFGEEKERLIGSAVDRVIRRYPDYPEKVRKAFNSPEMQHLREVVRDAIKSEFGYQA